MASKSFPHKNVFNTGEVSDRFGSRTDVGKYYSALKRLINFLPFTQGGVTRRPALRFGLNNFCDLEGRIIPFKFTRDVDSNFLIHLCDEALFITDDNGTEIPVGATGPLLIFCEEFVDDNVFVDPALLVLPDACARFNCSTSAKLNFRATGGVAPYSWSIVPSAGTPPTLTVFGLNDRDVTVTTPVNVGSSASAYLHSVCSQGFTGPNSCFYINLRTTFDCNDNFVSSNSCSGGFLNCPSCCVGSFGACDGVSDPGPCQGCISPFGVGTVNLNFEALEAQGFCNIAGACQPQFPTNCGDVVDVRSAGTIAAGCNPCAVAIGESVLTLTDNVGTMTTIILKADP